MNCLACGRPLGQHSHDSRDVCNRFVGVDAEIVLTQAQEDAIYSAYMGISVLSTMCKKAGVNGGRIRSEELLKELAEAFPKVYERVLLQVLR